MTDKHGPWPPPDWDEDVSDAYRLGVADGMQQISDFGQWVLGVLQELQQAVKKADTEARWAQATASSITVISIIHEMKRRGLLP